MKGTALRNLIFGIEDSLVSTVGLLAGIAAGTMSRSQILFVGVVYLCVEGFSMAVGSYLSEESAEEFEAQGVVAHGRAAGGAVVMLASFLLAGAVPLVPYLLLPEGSALYTSVTVSIIALGLLGAYQARISHVRVWPRVLRMLVLGGGAILIGLGISFLFGIS